MREVIKAVSKTGGGALAITLLTVITGKVVALVLGPHGVGLFAVTQQLQMMAIAFATFGGFNALVQGVASREGTSREQYIGTTFWLFVAAGTLSASILVAFAPWIAPLIAGKGEAVSSGTIRWIAIPAILGVLFTHLSGLLNGFRAIGRLAVVKVAGAAAMALLAYPLCLVASRSNDAALVWLISSSMLVQAVLSFIIARRENWMQPMLLTGTRLISGEALKSFFSIAGVLLITSQIASTSIFVVTSLLLRQKGLASVGIFNAAWTLSMNYVLLILTSFGTYYLPVLSNARDQQEKVRTMSNVFRLTVLMLVPMLTALIVLKPLVITVLYSGEFSGALLIIRWMLIGNYLRVFGWLFATPAMAYADMRTMFWAETGWSLGFLILSAVSLLAFDSVQGIGVAFIVLYAAYLAFYVGYVRRRHEFTVAGRDAVRWFLGLAIVLASSLYCWRLQSVEWASAAIWIAVAVCFSWFVLRSEERRRLVLTVRTRLGAAA